jgi:hypothetical protein
MQVVRALQPKLLIHGHLHHDYTDDIRCGNDGRYTHVIALNANTAEGHEVDDDPWLKSWEVLSLEG